MDIIENAPANQPDLNELQSNFDALQHLVVSILILFVVVTCTFDLFLLRLVKTTRDELKVLRPMMAEYNRTTGPAIGEFVRKLNEFGKTHADFAPILAKYGIKPAGATGAAPVSATPPAPGPLPKKQP